MTTTWKYIIVLDKDADEIWKKIRNFLDLGWAGGIPVKSINNRGGDVIGSRRQVADGPCETLLDHSDERRTYTYDIYAGGSNKDFAIAYPDSISRYQATLHVEPVNKGLGKCIVTWSASWVNINSDGKDVWAFLQGLLGGSLSVLVDQ